MEARVMKWQELAKTRKFSSEEYDTIRSASIKKDEEKRKSESIRLLLEKVPERFRNKTFFDYISEHSEQERVKAICERFVTTFSDRLENGTNATFLGNPGTGKTLLSLIMYQTLVKEGVTAHYEPSLQFLRIIQEKRNESHAAYQNVLEIYKKPQFLILDEVTESFSYGKECVPLDHERKLLFEVINARYMQKNRCTIVISNRDKNELSNRLGQPISDRLYENCIGLIFDWNSYRQK